MKALLLLLLTVCMVRSCENPKKIYRCKASYNLYDLMTQQERDKFRRYLIMLEALEHRRLSKRHSI